jgi:hypothetical protein
MARSLNPQLFGPANTPTQAPIPAEVQAASNKKIRDIENQVEVVQQKVDRLVQLQEAKFQHLMTMQRNMESQIRQVAETFSKQNAQIISKITEKKGAEVKIQDLIERHQQLVNNFETKLSQVQKVANEQEMKIMSYQATYDEVLREIRSLRR